MFGNVLKPDEFKKVRSLSDDKWEFAMFRTMAYYELAMNECICGGTA